MASTYTIRLAPTMLSRQRPCPAGDGRDDHVVDGADVAAGGVAVGGVGVGAPDGDAEGACAGGLVAAGLAGVPVRHGDAVRAEHVDTGDLTCLQGRRGKRARGEILAGGKTNKRQEQ